jgi:hypothetical protein
MRTSNGTNFNAGDIVKIKPEWRSPEEDPNDRYIVLEDRVDRSIVEIVDLEDKYFFKPTNCWPNDTMEVDENPSPEVVAYLKKRFGIK